MTCNLKLSELGIWTKTDVFVQSKRLYEVSAPVLSLDRRKHPCGFEGHIGKVDQSQRVDLKHNVFDALN